MLSHLIGHPSSPHNSTKRVVDRPLAVRILPIVGSPDVEENKEIVKNHDQYKDAFEGFFGYLDDKDPAKQHSLKIVKKVRINYKFGLVNNGWMNTLAEDVCPDIKDIFEAVGECFISCCIPRSEFADTVCN